MREREPPAGENELENVRHRAHCSKAKSSSFRPDAQTGRGSGPIGTESGGRESKRVQRGGFRSEADAQAALERALEKLRRESGVGRRLTLAEFVDEYLAQHEVSPVTLTKLRFLLTRAVQTFGDYYLDELDPVEISAWRMTVPPGYRFEATQALRQVLARAVLWRMLDINPAKLGVENPQRRRSEKRPFESWGELEALADRLGPRLGCSSPLRPACDRASG